jgi:hypothetical protein
MWTATSRLIQSIAGPTSLSAARCRGLADVINPCRLSDWRAAIRSATSPVANQRPSEGSMLQPLHSSKQQPGQTIWRDVVPAHHLRHDRAQRMGSRHDPTLVVPTAPAPHPYLDIVWRRRSETSAKRSSMYANRSLRDASHVAEQPATRWETAFAIVASGNSDSRGAQRRRTDSVQPRHAPFIPRRHHPFFPATSARGPQVRALPPREHRPAGSRSFAAPVHHNNPAYPALPADRVSRNNGLAKRTSS